MYLPAAPGPPPGVGGHGARPPRRGPRGVTGRAELAGRRQGRGGPAAPRRRREAGGPGAARPAPPSWVGRAPFAGADRRTALPPGARAAQSAASPFSDPWGRWPGACGPCSVSQAREAGGRADRVGAQGLLLEEAAFEPEFGGLREELWGGETRVPGKGPAHLIPARRAW